MSAKNILEGAWDLHFHAGPDVIPRCQHADEVVADARAAGMAGLGLKDHCGSTASLAGVLDDPEGLRVIGSVTLNPPAGGLNPAAVEAAFRMGARILWFPTYSTQRHLDVYGPSPFPVGDFPPLGIRDAAGKLLPEVHAILSLVKEYDGILSTGHLDPVDSLDLFRAARELGVKRKVLTHATLAVTDMPVELQQQAVELGAWIEHCMLSLTGDQPEATPEKMLAQIREIGPEHIYLTSDLGKKDLGPIVAGFAYWLEQLLSAGCRETELFTMVKLNPARLLFDD